MNATGAEIKRVLNASSIPLRRLVVWHDDVDLALGTIRLSWAARSGGHRGVASIERSIGSRFWWRLRFGISPQGQDQRLRKPDKTILADWLVAEANSAELKCYEAMGVFAGEGLFNILTRGGALHPTTWRLAPLL
jgi:PTH1 family peptidyl-tRNA hydrolase